MAEQIIPLILSRLPGRFATELGLDVKAGPATGQKLSLAGLHLGLLPPGLTPDADLEAALFRLASPLPPATSIFLTVKKPATRQRLPLSLARHFLQHSYIITLFTWH